MLGRLVTSEVSYSLSFSSRSYYDLTLSLYSTTMQNPFALLIPTWWYLKSLADPTRAGGIYRVCGLAVTAGIAVKFGTMHGRSRPAVGSAKCIGSYGRKGVPPAPCIFGTSQQKMITPTALLRPIYNFYSLTICS